MNNYVQVLWSAALLDLGVNAPYNRLTNRELMLEKLKTDFTASQGTNVQWPDNHEVDTILANMTVPLAAPQPVALNARYICRRMVWKTPANLVLDVLVATVSLFMAYWAVLNFVLSFIAVKSSPNG